MTSSRSRVVGRTLTRTCKWQTMAAAKEKDKWELRAGGMPEFCRSVAGVKLSRVAAGTLTENH